MSRNFDIVYVTFDLLQIQRSHVEYAFVLEGDPGDVAKQSLPLLLFPCMTSTCTCIYDHLVLQESFPICIPSHVETSKKVRTGNLK